MDLLNISQDGHDSDTSIEDYEEDYDDKESPSSPAPPNEEFLKWKRPKPQSIEDDLQFMLLDAEVGIINRKRLENELGPKLLPGLLDCELQTYVRIQGITKSGVSVACNLFNYVPYFYILPVPIGSFPNTPESIEGFRAHLNGLVERRVANTLKYMRFHDLAKSGGVLSIEGSNLNANPDMLDYNIFDLFKTKNDTKDTLILKVNCRAPMFAYIIEHLISDGTLDRSKGPEAPPELRFECYEAKLSPVIRFMTGTNLKGCSWLKLDKGKHVQRSEQNALSLAQVEVDVCLGDLSVIDAESELHIPELRILSLDLEMNSMHLKSFPYNGEAPIIQIANTFGTYGQGKPTKVIFTLKDCDPIEGAEVFSFNEEMDLLNAWRQFVLTYDPDILLGFNIKTFDLRYIINRAKRLDPKSKIPFIGRMKDIPGSIREIKNKLKRISFGQCHNLIIPGRIVCDMYHVILKFEYAPFQSKGMFKLDAVAQRLLKEKKEDLAYDQIAPLQDGDSQTRKKLATYCLQDSYIPYQLFQKFVPSKQNQPVTLLEFSINQSLKYGTPLKFIWNKPDTYTEYYRRVQMVKNPGSIIKTPESSPIKKPEHIPPFLEPATGSKKPKWSP